MPRGRPKKKVEEENKPQNEATGRIKTLDAIAKVLNDKYEEKVVQSLEDLETTKIPVISTGSLAVDLASGVGGIPRGRIIEVFGDESVGKTTLIMHIVCEAQKLGAVLFIDGENGFDPTYAKNLGIDLSKDKFILNQPNTAEEALDVIDSFVRSGHVVLVIVDSVPSLEPRAEAERDITDTDLMAILARFMSSTLRKINPLLHRTETTICFVNQIRVNVGGYGGRITPGGKALRFYACQRIDMRRDKILKYGEDPYGISTKIHFVKNKVAPPFKTGRFDLLFGKGISREGEILDYGLELGVVEKSGNSYSIGGEKIGGSRRNAVKHLLENPKETQVMEKKIRELYGI